MNRGLNVPRVKDILTQNVVAFNINFSISDVIKIFDEYRISSAPVINNANEVVGYFSENDSIKSLGNCLFFDEQRNSTIESIMATIFYSAKPEWDIFELDSFFISKSIGSAPVIDSDNHLVGVVTRRDALKALEKIVFERADYKKQIKDPIKLSTNQKIKVIIDNSQYFLSFFALIIN
jgi:CBS domain-containing protein